MNKFLKILTLILVCELVGIAGSIFTISSIPTWYASLVKPYFSPPNWLFGPVWTTLYAFMGISAFLIWEKGLKKKEVKDALRIFAIQLFLNAIWTPVFFGAKQLFIAFIIIVLMWNFILMTILKFKKIDKTASFLLIPYLLWVTFATILNFSLWYLNR
jgi:translocator protein